MQKKLIIIGGGAAGFFCAINAARLYPTLQVIILEKSNKLLSKVKISGGGRCNVTHSCFDIDEMSRCYPRGKNFVKKIFHQFFTPHTIEWFAERNVLLNAESDGRMFPVTNSSQTIINCLLQEAAKYKVDILMHTDVKKIIKKEELFFIECNDKRRFSADYLCIASGGYPKAAMFDWIKNIGHTVIDPVPSLFTFNLPNHPITKLMGVSVEKVVVKITATKLVQQGPLLITHWGLSGPAVLKLSAWGATDLSVAAYHFPISINWLPDYDEATLKAQLIQYRQEKAAQKIFGKNHFGLPQRLWEFLVTQAGVSPETLFADLPNKAINSLVRHLASYELSIAGKTTFKEEFVTAGGIKLSEIDANTMMSKLVSNLFFAGEVLDIDGITGGYNFQNAWTTGFVAAQSIAAK